MARVQREIEHFRGCHQEFYINCIWQDLVYADDITLLLASEDPEKLLQANTANAKGISLSLAGNHLRLCLPKSFNFVISPGLVTGPFFRRSPSERHRGGRGTPDLDAERNNLLATETDDDLLAKGILPLSFRDRMPFAWKEEMVVLGVTLDPLLSFRAHVDNLISKAKIRHGVMAALAKTNWGLETNVLRLTNSALLVSLTRYALPIVGAGMYEEDFRKIETRHTNTVARRITGVGRSARRDTMFMTAGIQSAQNLFLYSCAVLLDRSLRAYGSSINSRLRGWLSRLYQIETWSPEVIKVHPSGILLNRRGTRADFWEFDVEESWLCSLLPKMPLLPERFVPISVFHSRAEELNNPHAAMMTYDFRDISAWYEIGLQFLATSGWGPECAQAEGCDLERFAFPNGDIPPLIIIESKRKMRWLSKNFPKLDYSNILDICVNTFYEKNLGVSCAYIGRADAEVGCQGWVFGWDNMGLTPIYVREFALFHGLTIIDKIFEKGGSGEITLIRLRAGGLREINKLLCWFNEGAIRLKSAVREGVYHLLSKISSVLRCPLLIERELSGCPENARVDRLEDPASFNHGTKIRLLRIMTNKEGSALLCRIPRIPLTKEEVKERLKLKSERDELNGIEKLASKGSLSCRIFGELGLTREMIKMAMRELVWSRRQQVALSTVILATRFKFFGTGRGNTLTKTRCTICDMEDNWEHLRSHCSGEASLVDVDGVVEYLVRIAECADRINPHIPVPIEDVSRIAGIHNVIF